VAQAHRDVQVPDLHERLPQLAEHLVAPAHAGRPVVGEDLLELVDDDHQRQRQVVVIGVGAHGNALQVAGQREAAQRGG
jgi:hypothetical protein